MFKDPSGNRNNVTKSMLKNHFRLNKDDKDKGNNY